MCNRCSTSLLYLVEVYGGVGVGAPRGFQRPSGRRLFRLAVLSPVFLESPATVGCTYAVQPHQDEKKTSQPEDHQAELPDELSQCDWPSESSERHLLGPFSWQRLFFTR